MSNWFAVRVFADADFSWAAKLGSLLVLPFAHEDLAIVFGAYFIVHDLMPVGFVAISLYGGIVASDFALYGIGAGARRLPWLSRYALRPVRYPIRLRRRADEWRRLFHYRDQRYRRRSDRRWDPLLPVREVYRRLVMQQRLLFVISDGNRTRGFQPTPPAEFLRHLFRQTKLIQRYPPSS